MGDDGIGGADAGFPRTRHSVVRELASEEESRRQLAFDALVAAYWKPVYSYLRLRHGADSETAEDWTQGFFAMSLERESLQRFDASKARFRTWLRVCLDRWLSNVQASERRQKRGGQAAHLSLDIAAVEAELERSPAGISDVDASFEREWIRSLFELALEDLRVAAANKSWELDFQIFLRYDVEAPEAQEKLRYADLAKEFDVPETKVTNALHGMRRRFREALLTRLRQICASDSEFREEARALFGGNA